MPDPTPTPPTFTIHPLAPPDIPTCVSLYFTSFSTNTHSFACWPRNVPSVEAWWHNMFASELDEPGSHWLKAVHSDTRKLAAYCKWQDGSREPEIWKDGTTQWPEGADGRLCDETFGAWARVRGEVCGGRRCWYLEMIATAPEFQGQGPGSALIRWGLERADAEGLGAYLESSPDALSLYRKHGFREVSHLDTWMENERVPGKWYREVFMLRPAVAKS